MDGPFWGVLSSYGPGTAIIGMLVIILAAFVRAVLTGRLVPRATLEDVRKDRDARIGEITAERDSWRQAHTTSEGTRLIMAQQVEKLLDASKITNQILTSIKAEGPR